MHNNIMMPRTFLVRPVQLICKAALYERIQPASPNLIFQLKNQLVGVPEATCENNAPIAHDFFPVCRYELPTQEFIQDTFNRIHAGFLVIVDLGAEFGEFRNVEPGVEGYGVISFQIVLKFSKD